jgi:hypothetical protein
MEETMKVEFSNRGDDVFAAGTLTLEFCKQLLRERYYTDLTNPCCFCGVMPVEDDVWRIDLIGGVIREGHSRCFDGLQAHYG